MKYPSLLYLLVDLEGMSLYSYPLLPATADEHGASAHPIGGLDDNMYCTYRTYCTY